MSNLCDDVMVDLETLDTVATAAIISIGACRFNQFSDEIEDSGFYAVINLDSNLKAGRTISEDTLKFWLRADPAAQSVFFEKDKLDLKDALEELCIWVDRGRKTNPWSMGASFDVPMLEHAFRHFNIEPPWQFWDTKCMRHHKTLPAAKVAYNSVERAGTHHNAMMDALHQAKCAQAINRQLFPHMMVRPKPELPPDAEVTRRVKKAKVKA